jgi:hypothetical protein
LLQDGNTLLILAAKVGRIELLEELLFFHADINKPNQVVSLEEYIIRFSFSQYFFHKEWLYCTYGGGLPAFSGPMVSRTWRSIGYRLREGNFVASYERFQKRLNATIFNMADWRYTCF